MGSGADGADARLVPDRRQHGLEGVRGRKRRRLTPGRGGTGEGAEATHPWERGYGGGSGGDSPLGEGVRGRERRRLTPGRGGTGERKSPLGEGVRGSASHPWERGYGGAQVTPGSTPAPAQAPT